MPTGVVKIFIGKCDTLPYFRAINHLYFIHSVQPASTADRRGSAAGAALPLTVLI